MKLKRKRSVTGGSLSTGKLVVGGFRNECIRLRPCPRRAHSLQGRQTCSQVLTLRFDRNNNSNNMRHSVSIEERAINFCAGVLANALQKALWSWYFREMARHPRKKEQQIPGLLWMIWPLPPFSILSLALMGSGAVKMPMVPHTFHAVLCLST